MTKLTVSILVLVATVVVLLLFLFPLPGYESPFISAIKVHPIFGISMILILLGFFVLRLILLIKKW